MSPANDCIVFYDEDRRAVAWMIEDSYLSIYLYDGTPVALVVDDALYDYSGRYLGWMEDGWVWDRSGLAVLFTSEAEAIDGPGIHPEPPPRAARKPRPPLGPREPRPARAARASTWAPVSGELFFRR